MTRFYRATALAAVLSLMLPLSAAVSFQEQGIAPSMDRTTSSSLLSVPSAISIPLATKTISKKTTKVTSNYLNGTTKYDSAHSVINLSSKVDKSQSKRQVQLQQYNTKTKKWSVYKKTTVKSTGTFSFQVPKSTKTMTLRYHLPQTKTHKAYSSKGTTIYRPSQNSKVYTTFLDNTRQVPWQTNKLSTWIQVGGNSTATVELQEKKPNSTWKTVGKRTNFKTGDLSFTLPKGNSSSNDMKIQYKIVLKPGKVAKTASSKTFTVQWDNPYKGSAKERQVFNYIKHKCPNTTVIMSSSLNKDGNLWGLAHMGRNTITMATDIPDYHLKSVSLHECAHHQQWKIYGNDWDGFLDTMNEVHGTEGVLGMERNAHCIAHQWSPNSYWIYGATADICTNGESGQAAREIAAGKKFLAIRG